MAFHYFDIIHYDTAIFSFTLCRCGDCDRVAEFVSLKRDHYLLMYVWVCVCVCIENFRFWSHYLRNTLMYFMVRIVVELSVLFNFIFRSTTSIPILNIKTKLVPLSVKFCSTFIYLHAGFSKHVYMRFCF